MTSPNDTIARLWAFAAVLRPPSAPFTEGVSRLALILQQHLLRRLESPAEIVPALPADIDAAALQAVQTALEGQPWLTAADVQAPSAPPRQLRGAGWATIFCDAVASAAASGRLTAAWRRQQRCEAPPVRWTPWSTTAEAPPWPLPDTWRWVRPTDILGRVGLVGDGDKLVLAETGPRVVLSDEVTCLSFAPLGAPTCAADPAGVPPLAQGDVLVAREGQPLARACVFPGLGIPALPGPGVTVFRGDPSFLRSEALAIVLLAPEIRARWGQPSRGRIPRRSVQELRFPLPPLAEQGELARRVPALLGRATQLGLYLDLLTEQARRRSDAALQSLCCDGGSDDPAERLQVTALAEPGPPARVHIDPQLVLRDPYGALKQLLVARRVLRNQEVQDELGLDAAAARGLLQLLVTDGLACVEGSKRGTRYVALAKD